MASIDRPFFTHTSADSHDCLLCGSQISLAAINRRGEGWKAVVQELRHASPAQARVRQVLVQPAFCSHTFPPPGQQHQQQEEPRVVHAACWNIVARLWGRHAFTIAELDGFLDCARNIAPFLPDIPFKASPEHLDITIDHRLDPRDLDYRPSSSTQDNDARYWDAMQSTLRQEHLVSPALVGIERHNLPDDLEAFVAHALRHGSDVRKSPDSTVRYWAEIISMLANSPATQFAKDEPERPSRIAQAMRNLRLGGIARFPHTTNFDVVRANALTILVTLIPIPVEDLVATESKDGRRARLERPRNVPLRDIKSGTPFRLNFYTLRRQCMADRIRDRTVVVGMKYLRFIEFDETRAVETDLVPTIPSLCGVRLIRDGIGVLAVHAKDGPSWLGIWQQDLSTQLSEKMAVKATTAEWTAGVDDGVLTVTSDTAMDLAVGVRIYPTRKTTA